MKVTLIVEPKEATHNQLDKPLDDFFEAIDYYNKTGFAAKVRLLYFKDGKPVYERIVKN